MRPKVQTTMGSPGEPAWSRVARGASGRRIIIGCLAVIALGSIAGILVPAGAAWDFGNFYDAGRRAATGNLSTLYEGGAHIGDEAAAGTMLFWGMPLSAFLYAPLAGLEADTALIAFKTADVLALVGGLVMLLVWLRRFADDPEVFLTVFVVAAVLFQPFWTIFRVGGQSTPFAFLLLCSVLLAHTRERFFVSWACFAGAVMIKPILAPGLIFLLAFSGRRAFLAALPVGVVFAAVSLGVAGWPVHAEFLSRISSGTQTVRHWWFNSALAQPFYYLPALVGIDPREGPHIQYPILRWAGVLAVITATVRLVRAPEARALPREARLHLACLVAIPLPILVAPIAWEHYLVFLFPLFMFVLASRSAVGAAGVKIVTVAVVLALGQNLLFVLALADAIGRDQALLGLGVSVLKSAPCWLALWLLWRHRDGLIAAHATIPAGAPA